jgi:hypothetical protein
MLTTKELALTLQKGQWTTSIDLSDAYLHIPIHKDSRKYLRFVHRGVVFQSKALPFGLSDSPYVLTQVIKVVLQTAQSQGVQLLGYLDDWLNRGFQSLSGGWKSPLARTPVPTSRVVSEPGKIRTSANSEAYVRRNPVGFGRRFNVSYSGENFDNNHAGKSNSSFQDSMSSQGLADSLGPAISHGKIKSRGAV